MSETNSAPMADIWALINVLPERLPPDSDREWKIAHTGKVSKPVVEVVAGLLTGIAILAVAVRVVIHVRQRTKLFIDDYIVLFATACLVIETACLYRNLNLVYIEESLARDPSTIILFTRGQVLDLINNFLKWSNIWQTFAWTTNYMIKISFLAFFRILTKDVSLRLTLYWWFVISFTMAAWIFFSVENFIFCGASKSLKCFPYPRYNHEIGISSTAADVITDLMIISIPILLLRRTQLRCAQKLRILTFLCLSIVMTVFSVARFAGGLFRDTAGVLTYSLAWTVFLLHIEASIAVLMGGVTAFRTVFKRHGQEGEEHPKSSSPSSFLQYVKEMFNGSKITKVSGTEARGKQSAEISKFNIPTGTLRGVRTFIRRYGRDAGHTTMEESIDMEQYDPLESYHKFLKHGEEKSNTNEMLRTMRSSTEVIVECPFG